MKVELVPSAIPLDGVCRDQFSTSYVVNDTLAIDAGCLGFYRGPVEQARIKHVLISHTHMDHIASLPIFVENVYEGKPDCVTIHASETVLDSLARDVFNDRVWPDFIKLSTVVPAPFLKLQALHPHRAVELEGLKITPVEVNHVVPTLGFVVEGHDAAVIVVSDTGPTEEIWQWANRTPNLKAVFLEVTFPDAMAKLADISKHLTPASFRREARKLKGDAAVIAVHLKARFRGQVVDELRALGMANLEIGKFGEPYAF